MTAAMTEDVARLYLKATKHRLAPDVTVVEPQLNQTAVKQILPHRPPMLFIDQVVKLDIDAGNLIAKYRVDETQPHFAGHFPEYPIWPGVLQVEAITQAGLILYLAQNDSLQINSKPFMTHITSARFMRPIRPDGDVEIVVNLVEEGFIVNIVGQCIYQNEICSIAATNVLVDFD